MNLVYLNEFVYLSEFAIYSGKANIKYIITYLIFKIEYLYLHSYYYAKMYLFEELPYIVIESIFKHSDLETCLNIHKIVEMSEYLWKKQIKRLYGQYPEEFILFGCYRLSENILLGCIYAGIDINKQFGQLQTTLLHIACRLGSYKVTKLLISKGVNINHTDSHGDNTLFCALYAHDYEIVKLLIEKGIDINHKSNYGDTALHLAILYKSDKKIVKLLIEKGIDVFVRDSSGTSALDSAIYRKYNKMAKLLQKEYEKYEVIY